jgi:hypothetical protein
MSIVKLISEGGEYKMAGKSRTIINYRSAKTGKFVSKKYAVGHKSTTEREKNRL